MAVINQSIKDNQVQEVKVGGVDKFFFFAKVPGTEWLLGIELDKFVELVTVSNLMRQLIITAVIITGYQTSLLLKLSKELQSEIN